LTNISDCDPRVNEEGTQDNRHSLDDFS